jgi:hypothetical protein
MKRVLLSALLSCALIGSNLIAKEGSLTTKEINQKSLKLETRKANEKNSQVELVKDAVESLKLAQKALNELEKNDTKGAKKDIELALGKLEVILSSEKAPKLLPIDSTVSVVNFIGGSKEVKKTVKEVKELLDDGKVQDARILLNTLMSEIDINVVNLPLASYPDALRLASKYLLDNRPNEAKEVLRVALSTFTNVVEVIPIPLVNATHLIAAAQDMAKKDKKRALEYLDGASDELDKAEALGYLSESSTTYKELHKLIKDVQSEIKGKNSPKKLFENLTKKLEEFKDRLFKRESK